MKLHRDDCRSRSCRGCGVDSETNKLKRRVEELEKENAELRRKIEDFSKSGAWPKIKQIHIEDTFSWKD